MTIETERLNIIALTPEQLELFVNDILHLEKVLKFSYQGEAIEGTFREILFKQVKKSKEDRWNYLWHSFWLIIRKSDHIAVGMIDFKNVPNEKREVEIGYGLGKHYEHYGYMTETVKAICDWAKKQAGVATIIAETEPDNIGSEKVLQRCGFVEYSRNETVWWRL